MKIIATLSDEFDPGSLDTKFATDWIHLTPDEQLLVAQFMFDLGNGIPLKGKNKPSWVDDDFNKILGTDGYEQENYWHYHCGPTWYPNTFKGMTVGLAFNPNGMHSDECIHYIKNAPDTITIVGYSRLHIPFPPSDFGKSPFFPDDD